LFNCPPTPLKGGKDKEEKTWAGGKRGLERTLSQGGKETG